jgi:hypothetical protein
MIFRRQPLVTHVRHEVLRLSVRAFAHIGIAHLRQARGDIRGIPTALVKLRQGSVDVELLALGLGRTLRHIVSGRRLAVGFVLCESRVTLRGDLVSVVRVGELDVSTLLQVNARLQASVTSVLDGTECMCVIRAQGLSKLRLWGRRG